MKAQVEVQFNWVIVLVAGSLIFLFFFGIVRWVQKSGDASSSVTVSNYLDSILTGSSVAKDTISEFQLPAKEVHFTCTTYRLGESETSRQIPNKILFAPSRIERGRFIAWSLPWEIPFRAANFLYLTSPEIRYVFYGDPFDPLYLEIQSAFPAGLSAEFNPQSLTNTNTFKVRVISINPTTSNPNADPRISLTPFRSMENSDFTVLEIKGLELSRDAQLTFYEKTPPAVSVPSLRTISPVDEPTFGKAAIFGAIFSDSFEDYSCSMAKALARMRNVAEIYDSRRASLALHYGNLLPTPDISCEGVYAQPNLFSGYLTTDLQTLTGLSNVLESQNTDAQRASCSLLY